MTIVLGLAVALILAGLAIAFLSRGAGRLAGLFWWVGVVLAVIGLVLLLQPVLNWIANQLRVMLAT